MIFERCRFCRNLDERYCPHNGVLLVHIDSVPLLVRGSTEASARRTADKVRVVWRGAPFHRKNDHTAEYQGFKYEDLTHG